MTRTAGMASRCGATTIYGIQPDSVVVKTPKQYFTKIREALTPESAWIKGDWNVDGGMCLGQALKSPTPTGSGYSAKQIEVEPYVPAGANFFRYCMELLASQIPDTFGEDDTKIATFNDHPDTTHADVLALLDRCIAKAQTDGAQSNAPA